MVSLDAVADEDVDFLLGLPNFSSLCKQGTLVRDVDSVFVSNTYPAHSSIITGVHPQKHGITENTYTVPGKPKPVWRCDSRFLQAGTLYEKAAEAGIDVCSILFPVTLGAKIRWNFPEIPGEPNALSLLIKMLRGGTANFIISSLWRSRKELKGFSEPHLDDILVKIAVNSLRKYKPGLLLLHLLDADAIKHKFGPQSEQARDALKRHDARLGQLTSALEDIGPELSIIVFSDHGCLPIHTVIEPNEYLRRDGLIRGPGTKARDFDAFFHNAGGTTFLKVLNSEKNGQAMKTAEELLKEPFAKRMLTGSEMTISGMGREFSCGIEANEGFCFGEQEKGQHGYGLQRSGYHPFYLAVGPNIRQNEVQEGGCIVDICPLAAKMLDIPLWEMDGKLNLPFLE